VFCPSTPDRCPGCEYCEDAFHGGRNPLVPHDHRCIECGCEMVCDPGSEVCRWTPDEKGFCDACKVAAC
jgi:hypothetical protein